MKYIFQESCMLGIPLAHPIESHTCSGRCLRMKASMTRFKATTHNCSNFELTTGVGWFLVYIYRKGLKPYRITKQSLRSYHHYAPFIGLIFMKTDMTVLSLSAKL